MEQIYEIKRVAGSITWEEIPVLQMEYAYLNTPEDITAFGQICAGGDALFVRLWAHQPQIRAEEFGLDGLPYKDSCLEFFFRPEDSDPRYLNFEFNFNKCLYLGIGTDLETRQRILLEEREEIFKPETWHTEKGWGVSYQVPYAFIRRHFPKFCVYEGKRILANCYTCADLADTPYYLSWSEVNSDFFSFHQPECFGLMRIV